jgi:hypothetical protein
MSDDAIRILYAVRWFSAIGMPFALLASQLKLGHTDPIDNAVGFAVALVLGAAWASLISHRYHNISADG